MRVVVLASGRGCQVLAELPDEGDDECDSLLELELDAFRANGGSISKDVDRMLAVFDFIASHGRQESTKFFHEANKNESIYEFTRGNLRVYFSFLVETSQVVLCSHSIRKKKAKAAVADVNRAKTVRDKFLAEKKQGTLRIIERIAEEDDGHE